MSNQGFDKNSGPGTGIPKQTPFGYRPPSQSSSSWFNGSSQKPEGLQRPAVPPTIPSHNPGTEFLSKTQVQDLKRTRSPSFLSTYKNVMENSRTVEESYSIPQRTRSPPHVYQRNHPGQGFAPSSETKRPSISPPRFSTPPNSNANPESHVWYPRYADLDKPESFENNSSDIPIPKRSRLPFSTSTNPTVRANVSSVDVDTGSHSIPQRTKSPPHVYQRNHLGQGFAPSSETKRPSISPPRLSTRPNTHADPESHVWYPPYADLDKPESLENNPSNIPIPKQTRLPFPTSTDPPVRANNSSVDDDTERELQAKEKRLARFRNELSQPEPGYPDNRNQKAQKVGQLGMEKIRLVGESSDMMEHVRSSNLQPDGEDQDLSTIIIGYCPDMCPEQERAERERKGDLDQYERLDGDRNQTTGSLAVKKYTRTAEREAALIRPMPILQKTMNYLLDLLDLPYDDRFLGLYNFLWDRMRAIRMDLRMQHIFNLGAITMLEQMIRLHIIAMHELCEYTKGEGFSEGFDAHLNIEQMNKTSVELFQLYDDHRKKGIEVPTEREFRGYYALLKLDKHPGYKVEPSELSLDLAKMTPGIRQAAEVLFARNVARACRTGNFVVFFRLVRKASYLQACLMHAHFGKLRTQALASLHSGLQNNQGVPVMLVAKWLGMEEENVEDLLEHHGFSIKDFDEPYMVRERQFLNGDSEYPLRCSKLVHLKRSRTVVDDVLSSSPMESPLEAPKLVQVDIASMEEEPAVVHKDTESFKKAIDNEIADFRHVPSIKEDVQVQPMFGTPSVDRWSKDNHLVEVASSHSARDIFRTNNSIGSPKAVTTSVVKPSFDTRFRNSLEKHGRSNVSATLAQVTPRKFFEETSPDLPMDSSFGDSVIRPGFVGEDLVPDEPANVIQEVANEIDNSIDEEVAEAKLKLILRLWRRRALIKKDLRDKKQLAATAALSSLSLGPPMRHHEEQSRLFGNLNIDRAMFERYKKQEKLWSVLNVSNVVASTLGERNKYPRCICWKLLFCSSENPNGSKVTHYDPGSWLRNKLMPENISNNDDLLVSSPTLSIWKKWDYEKSSGDWTCYLSVIKNIQFDNIFEETVMGASAVMFLASEQFSWETHKIRLFNIVSSIPQGSCLPLLIVTGSYCIDPSIVVQNLGLNEVDKSRISSFFIVPLVKNNQSDGFFSDEDVRTGLEWLATESPLQPVVHRVKTRELVLAHTKFSFDARKTSPELCISAINEALDESILDIVNTMKSNPIGWPCPEIMTLNEPDYKILEPHLPDIGWSSATRIEPFIQALNSCKLPDISWHHNRSTRIDIEHQRLELEHFLVSYLSPLMGFPLAQKEASTLIQNFVTLELHGSAYYLVPKWIMIFKRIFNWQLTGLSNGPFSTTYISEESQKCLSDSLSASESFEDESINLVSPSLDEMIEVSCLESDYGILKEASVFDHVGIETVVSDDDGMEVEKHKQVESESNHVENERKENERSLSRLLEQCNIVQDMIDKKLSIYF